MTDPTPIVIVTGDQLASVIERIERLEDEKKETADLIKKVYAEAKANGFDPAILRKVIALRKQPAETRERTAAMLETYLAALGLRAGGV